MKDKLPIHNRDGSAYSVKQGRLACSSSGRSLVGGDACKRAGRDYFVRCYNCLHWVPITVAMLRQLGGVEC